MSLKREARYKKSTKGIDISLGQHYTSATSAPSFRVMVVLVKYGSSANKCRLAVTIKIFYDGACTRMSV